METVGKGEKDLAMVDPDRSHHRILKEGRKERKTEDINRQMRRDEKPNREKRKGKVAG